MASILDAFPYPFFAPEAQQLHITLTQLNPTARAALLVAERAGINTTMINGEQAPFFVWKEILEAAATGGLTRDLVQGAHDLLPAKSPGRPFLEALLTNAPVYTEGEPRTPGGAPGFITNDDEVSEPEALLYHDDLTIQIGRVPGLISTLQLLLALAPAVCKLVVDVQGLGKYGTGFRIGPDLLLTNWHVLHRVDSEARATAVTAEFGYEHDSSGGTRAATPIPCDVSSIVAGKDDDWAVIRPAQSLLDAWPIIKLSEAAVPVLESSAYIIQHPGGQHKRLGFVRNQVSAFDERVVHYLTDTKEGSSGAPVFNAEGRLIALHHAGGRPQELVGRAPLKKNEGIRIARIVAGLSDKGIHTP